MHNTHNFIIIILKIKYNEIKFYFTKFYQIFPMQSFDHLALLRPSVISLLFATLNHNSNDNHNNNFLILTAYWREDGIDSHIVFRSSRSLPKKAILDLFLALSIIISSLLFATWMFYWFNATKCTKIYYESINDND